MVEKELIERKKLSTRLWDGAYGSTRQCLVDECSEKAISSHLLQKKGILSNLTVDQHLYEIGALRPFEMEVDAIPISYRHVGINRAMTLPLFCKTHDTQLFKDIEKGDVDHSDYRNQLLFAYRSCAGELRKKEVVEDFFASMLFDEESRKATALGFLMSMHSEFELNHRGIEDLRWYISQFESDLNGGTESFRFVSRAIDPLDVAVSSLYTPLDKELIYNPRQTEPLPLIFINVIPRAKVTHIVVGHHLEHATSHITGYIEQYTDLGENDVRKVVSEAIIKHCEAWAMSPRLYDKIGDERKQEILNQFHLTGVKSHEDLKVDIDIFDNP